MDVDVTLAPEGAGVMLAVEDDGPGIPAEDRDRVLERFVRRDDCRTRSSGGTGLGLAIVVGVAAAHGGSVTVTNGTRGGARIEVQLPRHN